MTTQYYLRAFKIFDLFPHLCSFDTVSLNVSPTLFHLQAIVWQTRRVSIHDDDNDESIHDDDDDDGTTIVW